MPTVDRASKQAVARVLKSGFLTPGAEAAALETELARKVRRRHAVTTNSGHAALHLALLGLGVGERSEVIVPTYVCSALLNAVHYTGAKPVIADVDPETYLLGPEQVRPHLGRRTAAVIVPHMLGRSADIAAVAALGPPVIEDAAMAIGGRVGKAPVGATGAVSIFSFYGTKLLTTGQGGAVATDRPRIASLMRDLVAYDKRPDYRVRYNYTLSDLQAALGRAQLKALPGFLRKRKQIARLYDEALRGLPGVVLPPRRGHTYYRYGLRLDRPARAAIAALRRRGVEAKLPVFRPLHRYLKMSRRRFPHTESFTDRLLSIPIYPSLSLADARRVAAAVRATLGA